MIALKKQQAQPPKIILSFKSLNKHRLDIYYLKQEMENRPFYLTNDQKTPQIIGKDRFNSEYNNLPISVKFIAVFNTNYFFVVSFNSTIYFTQAKGFDFFLLKSREISLESLLNEYCLGIIFSFEGIPKDLILYPRLRSNLLLKLELEVLDYDSLLFNDYTRDLKFEGFSIMIDSIKHSCQEKNESIKTLIEKRLESINASVDSCLINAKNSISLVQSDNKALNQRSDKASESIDILNLNVNKLTAKQDVHVQSNTRIIDQIQSLELKFKNSEIENQKLKEHINVLVKNQSANVIGSQQVAPDNRIDEALKIINSLSSKLNTLTEETAHLKNKLKQKDSESTEIRNLKSNYQNLSEKMNRLELFLASFNKVDSDNSILKSVDHHMEKLEINPKISELQYPNHNTPKDTFNVANTKIYHSDIGKSFYSKNEEVSDSIGNFNLFQPNNGAEEDDLMMSTSILFINNQEIKKEDLSIIKTNQHQVEKIHDASQLIQMPSNEIHPEIKLSSEINVLVDINDKKLAIGRKDGQVSIRFKSDQEKELLFWDKHKSEVTCLLFVSKLISGSSDKTIKIWNFLSIEEAPFTVKISAEVTAFQNMFSVYFCCGSSDQKLTILDSSNGKVIRILSINSSINDILYMNSCLIVASDSIKAWHVKDLETITLIGKDFGQKVYSSLFQHSPTEFFAGSVTGKVEKWYISSDLNLVMKKEFLSTNKGCEVTRMHRLNKESIACCSNKNIATVMTESNMTLEGLYETFEWYKGIAQTQNGFIGVYELKSIKSWSFN